ncbi:Alpha and gamma adaptin binding protein p34 domain containing protein [Elaphomyces granulatus]
MSTISVSQQAPKHVSNPRRLLILSPTSHAQATVPALLHSLTGFPVGAPPQTTPADNELPAAGEEVQAEAEITTTTTTTVSFAGYTTHAPFRIETKYYTADVPIWVDEISLPIQSSTGGSSSPSPISAPPSATAAQWKTEFLSSEAQVVREAIGAVVVCVQNPAVSGAPISSEEAAGSSSSRVLSDRAEVRALKDFLKMISEVKTQIEDERGGIGEVPGLLVLMETKGNQQRGEDDVFSASWWEDELYAMGVIGYEVVSWDPTADTEEGKRNQFGEFEGMGRIKEALETHEWADTSDAEYLLDPDEEEDGFNLEVNELEREMLGLRMAIEKGGGDADDCDTDADNDDLENAELQVEEMETLMMRVRAIKDMSADLPEGERKAFAEKAIRDIMREL